MTAPFTLLLLASAAVGSPGIAAAAAADTSLTDGEKSLLARYGAPRYQVQSVELEPGPPAPAHMPVGCFVDNATGPISFKYAPGNLFPATPHHEHGRVYTDTVAGCCTLCQSFKNCTFWTYERGSSPAAKPTCYGMAGACCYLKTAAAWAGRSPGEPSGVSGSTKTLPPLPPPPPPPPPPPAPHFIAANDPNVWYTGRTMINADGSRSFDWEGTQLWVNLAGANYVKMVLNATDGMVGRFSIEVNGVEAESFFVGDSNSSDHRSNEYMAAMQLNNAYAVTTVRAISILEPDFGGANVQKTLTFIGWETDGRLLPASAPRTRKIELLGDSISAGYGSRGDAKLHAANSCPVNAITSGNKYTYNWKIAEHFDADLVPIAWSGKGMYKNCCDNGELMPAYWLQTLGGMGGSTDWDHSRYVPDMIIINLGTNDFGHDAGPAWEKAFSDTYTEFVLNATRIYKNPKLPVFVAQGPMNCDAKLGAALNVSIAAINGAGGNAVFLDLKGPPNDGCGGHPGVLGHEGMAEMAYPQIAKVMNWD